MKPDLEITGVLACMYDSRLRLAREVLAELRSHFPEQLFKRPIAQNVKLAETPSFSRTIFEYAPESKGAEDYLAVAREFLEREGVESEDEARSVEAPPGARPGGPHLDWQAAQTLVASVVDAAPSTPAPASVQDPEGEKDLPPSGDDPPPAGEDSSARERPNPVEEDPSNEPPPGDPEAPQAEENEGLRHDPPAISTEEVPAPKAVFGRGSDAAERGLERSAWTRARVAEPAGH
jgi:hypothetical protein